MMSAPASPKPSASRLPNLRYGCMYIIIYIYIYMDMDMDMDMCIYIYIDRFEKKNIYIYIYDYICMYCIIINIYLCGI